MPASKPRSELSSALRSEKSVEVSTPPTRRVPACLTLEAQELAACLNAFLETLSRRDRSLLLGRYFYGFTEAELAKRLNMKQSGVHTILYRSRERLREFLKKEEIRDE